MELGLLGEILFWIATRRGELNFLVSNDLYVLVSSNIL